MPCCLVALLFSFPFGTAALQCGRPAGSNSRIAASNLEWLWTLTMQSSTLMLEKTHCYTARRLLPERRRRAASA